MISFMEAVWIGERVQDRAYPTLKKRSKRKGSDFRYLYPRNPSWQPRLQNSLWTILHNIPFVDIKVKTG